MAKNKLQILTILGLLYFGLLPSSFAMNARDIGRLAEECQRSTKGRKEFKGCEIPKPQLGTPLTAKCGDKEVFVRMNNLTQSQSKPFGTHVMCSIQVRDKNQVTHSVNLRKFDDSKKERKGCAKILEVTKLEANSTQKTSDSYCSDSNSGGLIQAESSETSEDYTLYRMENGKKKVIHKNVTREEYAEFLRFNKEPEGRGKSEKRPKQGGTPTGV